MASKKITQLLNASALDGSELLEVVQDGQNKQCSAAQILSFVGGGGGGTTLTDALVFKGVIDCSSNPNYPAADAGDTYKVSVAGKIGGGSGPNVEAGDLLLCIADSTSSGNHATVGSYWTIQQVNIDGAVTGPASATNGNFSTFNGTSGKTIQDSGYSPSSFDASGSAATVQSNLDTHIADTSNPHDVTASQVGLGNVDNTSDVNKPVSTAQQAALDLKANLNITYLTKTNDYTLTLSEFTNVTELRVNKATAVTVTIPPNSSAAFPVGFSCIVKPIGAGQITFSPGVGVTITTSSGTFTSPARNHPCVIEKTGTNTWEISNGMNISDLALATDLANLRGKYYTTALRYNLI